MTALLLDRPVPVTLHLIDAVESADDGALAASVIATVVGIVRDPRPAIPRRVWVAQTLRSGHARPTEEALATADAVIAAVHAHDYHAIRGEI